MSVPGIGAKVADKILELREAKSANPTCVSSLEISKRTISPENTRSYQPGKTETNLKKQLLTFLRCTQVSIVLSTPQEKSIIV
jgi:hypothetical protein